MDPFRNTPRLGKERHVTSRLTGGTRSKHNEASVKAPFAIFAIADSVKCAFFCFAFKRKQHTVKDKAKGIGGTLAKG